MEYHVPLPATAWWLSVPGVGVKTVLALQAYASHHGSELSELIESTSRSSLDSVLSQRQQAAAAHFYQQFSIEGWQEWLQQRQIELWPSSHPGFPSLLGESGAKPEWLWVKGTQRVLQATLPLAVVGTRRITEYGRMMTEQIVAELVAAGATIVSGYMYGVDFTAHQAALACGGATVAVLGYGLGSFADRQASVVHNFIDRGGCFISQFSPLTTANKSTFPQRNAVIAGMSAGTLVVEAAQKSGTMITVQAALDDGREVWAVPGPANSLYTQGTKYLLNQGATLVATVADMIESAPQLPWQMARQANIREVEGQTKYEQLLFQNLKNAPQTFADIQCFLPISAGELQVLLTKLEMEQKIVRAGHYWRIGYNLAVGRTVPRL